MNEVVETNKSATVTLSINVHPPSSFSQKERSGSGFPFNIDTLKDTQEIRPCNKRVMV